MHVEIPKEEIDEFCRKWKIRELASVVPDLPEAPGRLRVRVDFDATAHHSLLDHVRLEREAAALFRTQVRVIENETLDYPLYGLPEEQADVDLACVQVMRSALEELVLHVVGLRSEIYEGLQSLQDSTIRQIIVVAELAARVSPTFRSAHPEVPWADLVDLRYILVQPYTRVAPARVWQTIERDLPEIGAALDRIAGIEPAGEGAYDVNLSFSGWGLSSDPGYR